jgi:hypothetical protein
MKTRTYITIALLAVTLVVSAVASYPGFFVSAGCSFIAACDRWAEHLSDLVSPPKACPWNQECI